MSYVDWSIRCDENGDFYVEYPSSEAANDGEYVSAGYGPIKHPHPWKIDEPKKEDTVNHPKHYTSHPSGVECIQITEHMAFNIGSAVKYLWRNGLKGETSGIEDLKKAVFFINREIALRSKLEEGK